MKLSEEMIHKAACFLEELHISGDTMVNLTHNICECNYLAEIKNIDGDRKCTSCGGLAESGAMYLHDVLALFAEKMKWQTFPARETGECEHPADAIIRDGDKDFCLSCNQKIERD